MLDIAMAKKYSFSGELMKDVRTLDYKQQYKVCAKFYKILKSLHEDSRMMYQRFYESFELIDSMDNALYETDTYTPMKFFEIAGKLAPMIK